MENKMNIAPSFRIKALEEKWIGKWYKPWTWFNKKYRVTIIKDAELLEMSLVSEK